MKRKSRWAVRRNRNVVYGMLILCILLLSACGRMEAVQEEAQQRTEEGQEAAQLVAEERSSENYPRELSKEELREFSIWISRGDNRGNYGFLLSEYEQPEDADLSQALYNGGGMESKPLSEEESRAYLEVVAQPEIYTDYTCLTTEQILAFAGEKLGVYEEAVLDSLKGNGWAYLADYDLWVSEHGDTNYMSFTCVSGRQTDAVTFELDCVPGDEEYVLSSDYISPCVLTVKEEDGQRRFVSNHFTNTLSYSKDIWEIEEQSFDVELEGWGDVRFVSYKEELDGYGNRDATFALVRDGETVYRFPAVEEQNYRRNLFFERIEAVSFRDFDGDGDEDVIIIISYKQGIHTEETDEMKEVRLYRNEPEEQSFVLEWDAMDWLNLNRLNGSVEEVMEHMSEAL